MPEPNETGSKEKKSLFSGKKKWWWVGGGIVLLAVIFYAVKKANVKSNQQSAQAGVGPTAPIDPATGYPEGSPADLNALGYSGNVTVPPTGGGISNQGPPGPAGPIGPTGPAGPAGPSGPGWTSTPMQPVPPPHSPPHSSPLQSPIRKAPANGGNTWYTVKAGDTLSGIAQKLLGNPRLWIQIYKANIHTIGTNPSRIHPGQRLLIPSR